MTDVKLTATVEAVLRGVAAGEVHYSRSLRGNNPPENRWNGRKVSREITKLREAGLVTFRMELGRLSAKWQLTEAGERWLAEHAKENN